MNGSQAPESAARFATGVALAMIAAPRVNARAWFALAVSVPLFLLAIAGAATTTGVARAAGFGLALLLVPAAFLALRRVETREFTDRPRGPNERALVRSIALTLGQACALLFLVLAGAPLSAEAVAVGLVMACAPLTAGLTREVWRRIFPPLEAPGVAQAVAQPDARGWQRPVERTEYERLQEVARQIQARANVAGLQPALGAQKEAGQAQQPVLVGLSRGAADRTAGARADVGEVVRSPGGRALAEIQAETEILQQACLEAHEERRPDVRVGESLAERLEGQIGPRVRLAFRQSAGDDRRRGGEAGQSERIVEQGGGPLPLWLEGRRAQLLGHPGAISDRRARSWLQEGAQPAGRAAGHVGGVAPVPGGEQVDDGAGLPVRAGGEHEGVVYEFHAIKLWAPAEEIQPSNVEPDAWRRERRVAVG